MVAQRCLNVGPARAADADELDREFECRAEWGCPWIMGRWHISSRAKRNQSEWRDCDQL